MRCIIKYWLGEILPLLLRPINNKNECKDYELFLKFTFWHKNTKTLYNETRYDIARDWSLAEIISTDFTIFWIIIEAFQYN